MPLTRAIARPMLASTFVLGGYDALRNPEPLTQLAHPVTDRVVALVKTKVPQVERVATPVNVVRLNAAVQLGAGLSLATGRAPRLSAAVLAASLVPTTVGGHRFWEEQDPAARGQQLTQFAKNLSMLGGLILASLDTEGRPSIAWRTRRAVHDASREARHLRRAARQQVRIAKASLPGT